jgi:MFS family permease
MATSLVQSEHDARQSKKAAASGWIGSALEYYDFFIYATAAALIFPQMFFPSDNPAVAIVASLATYGVGYVARPIGALFLGHWGDTHGRKTVLIVCMFLMGISTMAVGLLPTYQQVGVLAPVLLVILRLIQGFAVAGEISGASSMILEHSPFGRRGFYASFTLQGVQAGQILAAAVFLPLAAYMPSEAFNSWGWRIPFLLSFFVIVAGYIIRREVEETPAFAKEDQQGNVPKAPIVQAFRLSWRDMLRVVCMALMNVIPVVATIFGAAYAVQPAYGIGFEKGVYLWIPVLGNMLAVFVIPIVGQGRSPTSHHHRRPVFRIACVRLSLRDQHQERAAGNLDVAVDVGRRLSGLQRHLPELLPRTIPDANPRLGDVDIPEHGDNHHSAASGIVCHRGASWLGPYPPHRRVNRLRYHRDRGDRGRDRPRNLSDQHRRSRQA